MPHRLTNIVIYAQDPGALSAFWAAALGYEQRVIDGELRAQLLAGGLDEADLAKRGLAEDPDGRGPRLLFQHADGPKAARNRMHMDVAAVDGREPTPDELEAERDRLVALGATEVRLIEQTWGPFPERYFQMRDPEGNEFCLH